MARGINKVILVGNICADPELKPMTSGSVVNISLATSESWKDKNSGEKKENSEFHRLVFYNKLAEIVGEYVRKGSKLYVEGSLKTRKYQAQDGTDRYTTEIVVRDMQMLDSRPQSGNQGQGDQPSQYLKPQNSNQPAPPPANQPMGAHKADGFDDFDDDLIPF